MSATQANNILQSLDAFIRKYYKNRLIRGAIYSVALLLSLFLFVVVLEYFGYFPPLVRALLFWGYVVAALFIIVRFVAIPLANMYRLGNCIGYEQAAVIIGQHFPEVKDKLLNLIQLQNMAQNADSDLLRAGIEQKTAQLSPIPFKNAVNLKANRKYVKYAVIPLALIVLVAIIWPSFIAEPSQRLVDHSTVYERPAPFRFVVQNETLEVAQQDDFVLRVAVEGMALPAEAYIEYDGTRYRMQQIDRDHFAFTFKQQQRSVDFILSAGDVHSTIYHLSVLPKPVVIDFQVAIDYPAYTRQQDVTLPNQGDLTVAQGTVLRWSFVTRDVDTLFFVTDDHKQPYSVDKNGRVTVALRAMQSFYYAFYVANGEVGHSDTLRYSVAVVPDVAPHIVVSETKDSTLPDRRFFHGRIKDDYGFTRLEFKTLRTNISDTSVHVSESYPVAISVETSQDFVFSFNFESVSFSPGDRMEYYFEVWDNDGIHGPKSATSQQQLLQIPTAEELNEILDDNSEDAYQNAQKSIGELQQLQRDIDDMIRKLVDKKELDWQDKRQLEQLAEKQKDVRKRLEEMREQINENNRLEEKFREQSEQIRDKQEELNRLFDEVMTDEMRDLMKQMDSLLNKTNKQDVQRRLEELKMTNEQLENQIDQNIDLMRRLEVEKRVDQAIKDLDKLSDKQKELAEKTEKADRRDQEAMESLKKQQEEISKQYDEIQEQLKKAQQDYRELDQSVNFQLDKDLMQKIDQHQQDAEQKMGKKKNKEAAQQQKQAADEMEQLANQVQQEQDRVEQEDMQEDSEQIRMLLKSLIHLSKDQEELIPIVRKTLIQDPKYQEIISRQNSVKEDFKGVQDSLNAIGRRQVMVASAIAKEVGKVNMNVNKSLSSLLTFNQSFYGNATNSQTATPMQYAMTSINNLSLLLAESLDNMQNQMRQNSMRQKSGNSKQRRQGNCSNQGRQASPKSMKQLQEQLNKQMEAMKKELEKQGKEKGNQGQGKMGRHKIGQGNQMSEEFSKMAAQQEMIRRMMQEYGQELKQQSGGDAKLAKEIDELMRQMEQTENDLINKVISNNTMKRQEQIMTRLLEHEKAELQREKEQRRRSNEGVERYQPSPADLEQFEKLKKSNQDLFHTTPPSLTPYYKRKVSEYFYNM